jgi:hypothetical protein
MKPLDRRTQLLSVETWSKASPPFAQEVPGQRILYLADGMVCDLGQHGSEVEFRIESVELGRTDQGVHGGSAFAAIVRSRKEEVLPSKSDSSERPFCGAVVDLEQAIVGVACEGPPA